MQEIQKLLNKWGLQDLCSVLKNDDITIFTPGKLTHLTYPPRRGFYFVIGTDEFKKPETSVNVAQQTILNNCRRCPFYDKICEPEATAVKDNGRWRPSVMPLGTDGRQDVRRYNFAYYRSLGPNF